jgi:hypothetical protein
MLYAWTRCLRSFLPSVSEQRCAEEFTKEFGELIGNPSPKAMKDRIQKMNKEYHEARK